MPDQHSTLGLGLALMLILSHEREIHCHFEPLHRAQTGEIKLPKRRAIARVALIDEAMAFYLSAFLALRRHKTVQDRPFKSPRRPFLPRRWLWTQEKYSLTEDVTPDTEGLSEPKSNRGTD